MHICVTFFVLLYLTHLKKQTCTFAQTCPWFCTCFLPLTPNSHTHTHTQDKNINQDAHLRDIVHWFVPFFAYYSVPKTEKKQKNTTTTTTSYKFDSVHATLSVVLYLFFLPPPPTTTKKCTFARYTFVPVFFLFFFVTHPPQPKSYLKGFTTKQQCTYLCVQRAFAPHIVHWFVPPTTQQKKIAKLGKERTRQKYT